MIAGALLIIVVMVLVLLLNGMYLLLFTAGMLGGLLMFLRGMRTLRDVRDVPLSRVRSAAQGYVALQGRCLPLKDTTVLRSPLSRSECVWYRYRIFRRTRIDADASWTEVRQGSSHVPFLLDDGDGRCVVVPQGATVQLDETRTWYGDTDTPAPDTSLPATRATFRYVETRIDPGMTVFVHGEFTSRPADPGNAATDLLNAWKLRATEMLARFDSNDDGELDSQELRAAMQAARAQARAELDRVLAGNQLDLFGRPSDPSRAFIITTRPPVRQVRLLRLQTWLGAAGFVCGGAALIRYWAHGP